jgi:hypothetical protein
LPSPAPPAVVEDEEEAAIEASAVGVCFEGLDIAGGRETIDGQGGRVMDAGIGSVGGDGRPGGGRRGSPGS